MRINGLSFFQDQITPEWEDEVNSQGGEYRIDFGASIGFVQELWQGLVFSIITGEFKNAEMLAGVRILDKSTSGRENMFRIEVWTKFDEQNQQLTKELKEHLEKGIVQKLVESAETKTFVKGPQLSDAAAWIGNFKTHKSDGSRPGHQSYAK